MPKRTPRAKTGSVAGSKKIVAEPDAALRAALVADGATADEADSAAAEIAEIASKFREWDAKNLDPSREIKKLKDLIVRLRKTSDNLSSDARAIIERCATSTFHLPAELAQDGVLGALAKSELPASRGLAELETALDALLARLPPYEPPISGMVRKAAFAWFKATGQAPARSIDPVTTDSKSPLYVFLCSQSGRPFSASVFQKALCNVDAAAAPPPFARPRPRSKGRGRPRRVGGLPRDRGNKVTDGET